VNQELSSTISGEVDNLVYQVKDATVGEVKKALTETNDSISLSCNEFQRKLLAAVNDSEIKMKAASENFSQGVGKINVALDDKLRELEDKQKSFFAFEGAKHFFFWLSILINFGTFGLLIFFLFFKK
jgi:hypothetical protein